MRTTIICWGFAKITLIINNGILLYGHLPEGIQLRSSKGCLFLGLLWLAGQRSIRTFQRINEVLNIVQKLGNVTALGAAILTMSGYAYSQDNSIENEAKLFRMKLSNQRR